jgi:hypothetical protein
LRASEVSTRVRLGNNADDTMQMTSNTPFLTEAACAAPLTVEHSPVVVERRFDNFLALAERSAT